MPRGSLEERYWLKVDRRGQEDCWAWAGGCDHGGYGRIKAAGERRNLAAHRVAWEFRYGPIPGGLCVLHRCDNPGCVNPEHLFLGTVADNNRDKKEKGRSTRGESNHHSRLTEWQAIAIRSDCRARRAIAADYGICESQVGHIRAKRRWGHI